MGDSALSMLLDAAEGDGGLLVAFCCALQPHSVVAVSAVCKSFMRAGEVALETAACATHGWRLPRRSRLSSRRPTFFAELPWRTLYVKKSCRSCMARPGDFAVRGIDGGAPHCFLCARCAKLDENHQRLRASRATLDVTGLSGKPLYTKRQSKFCADVSQASKDSLDQACGARAELLRHGALRR